MYIAGISCAIKGQIQIRVFVIILVVCSFVVNLSPLPTVYAQDVQSEDAAKKVFLPLVTSSPASTPREQGVVLSPQEAEVENFFLHEPGQRHTVLHLNPTLVKEARRKAQDMADRVFFDHTDPDGYGPNYWARRAGYVFPDYYGTGPDANNIESIGAGYADASAVWKDWMDSPGHRSHLLGEHPFYQEQLDYGIGYVYKENGSYRYYWVILIAKPG